MGLRGFLTESDLNNIKLKTNNLKLEKNLQKIYL